MRNLKLLAEVFLNKHGLTKLAIDANDLKDQITTHLQTSVINASTQTNLGIMPFPRMLKEDNASLSLQVNRNDTLGSTTITVDSLSLNRPELAAKYSALPSQVQRYLDKYPELFVSHVNGESVTYNNFVTTLSFE